MKINLVLPGAILVYPGLLPLVMREIHMVEDPEARDFLERLSRYKQPPTDEDIIECAGGVKYLEWLSNVCQFLEPADALTDQLISDIKTLVVGRKLVERLQEIIKDYSYPYSWRTRNE